MQGLNDYNFLLFLPITTMRASTAEPKLGTAQPQLVLQIYHSVEIIKNTIVELLL